MARPCGCGSSGVIVRCGVGTKCTGVGTTGDPLVISWEIPLSSVACDAVVDCVGSRLGAGLAYTATTRVISAKISGDAGNTLSFGTDDGLLNTGTPDPTLPGATVADLPATNVLCSANGAGFSQWPDAVLKSYETAMLNEDISMVHVPCRRSQELMIFAVEMRDLNFYGPVSASEKSNVLDTKQNVHIDVQPSGPAGPNNPVLGYFGFHYPPQESLPELQDVFRVTARRVVLYLQNKDLGASVGDTPNPLTSLRQTTALIEKWGLQKNVILGTEIPNTANAADQAELKQGLQEAQARGIATAVHIQTAAQANLHTPASLVELGVTWVFCTLSAGGTALGGYRDAGLQVIGHPGNRQTFWRIHQALRLRGLLSEDPVYAAAETFGFRYRRGNEDNTVIPHSWNWGTPGYGQHAYSDGHLPSMHSKFRGYVASGEPGILSFGPDADPPNANSGRNTLMGEFCPIIGAPPNEATPTSYNIEVGFSWTQSTGSGQSAGLFFANPDDGPLFDLTGATAQTKGYSFVVANDGNFVFRRYDGVAGNWQFQAPFWASGFGAIVADGREYRILVQVRPGTVRVGRADQPNDPTTSRLFDATTGGGDRWRGRYFYLNYNRGITNFTGRIRFHTLKVTNV